MTKSIFDAIGAFFSTTLDDLLVLVYLFLDKSTDPNIKYPYTRIVIGQFLGFTIIVLISLIGLVLETSIPIQYIDLIGLIPLFVGCYKLYYAIEDDFGNGDGHNSKDEKEPILPQKPNDSPENQENKEYQNEEGTEQTNNITRKIIDQNSEDVEHGHPKEELQNDSTDKEAEPNFLVKVLLPMLKVILDPLILESTILSLMCGSDNIVIYTSLFATESIHKVVIVVSIFYGLLLFNAGIALVIVKVIISCHYMSYG